MNRQGKECDHHSEDVHGESLFRRHPSGFSKPVHRRPHRQPLDEFQYNEGNEEAQDKPI